MSRYFWNELKKPIIAMSPMDGVTDAAFRFITDKYGPSDILFTEFTSVEGLHHGATRLLYPFIHHKTETPTVAQIYGSTPEAFYNAALIVCEMGFDGVDINMGCPDKKIAKRGSGAGLIQTPKLAQKIIRTVQTAVKDYADGKKIEDADVSEDIINWIRKNSIQHPEFKLRDSTSLTLLPVSIKTRIGYDKIVTEEWTNYLLETEPAAIALHGRTLEQMYTGQANWEEIGKAANVVKQTNTLFLGNGDVKSVEEAHEKSRMYGLDGVLIGRASFGNPWLFRNYLPPEEEKKRVALEHCEAFMNLTPQLHYLSLRKHLAWYTKGLHNSAQMRRQLMQVENLEDVRKILED